MTDTTTTSIPEQRCPSCGTPVSGVTGLGDAVPEEGCVVICWECAGVGIYGAGGLLRLPEPGELEAWPEKARAKVERMRDARRAEILQDGRMRERVVLCDEFTPEQTEQLAAGKAAIIGCSFCGCPLWIAAVAPPGRKACPECAAQVVAALRTGA